MGDSVGVEVAVDVTVAVCRGVMVEVGARVWVDVGVYEGGGVGVEVAVEVGRAVVVRVGATASTASVAVEAGAAVGVLTATGAETGAVVGDGERVGTGVADGGTVAVEVADEVEVAGTLAMAPLGVAVASGWAQAATISAASMDPKVHVTSLLMATIVKSNSSVMCIASSPRVSGPRPWQIVAVQRATSS